MVYCFILQVLWLPSKDRDYVMEEAPGFRQVYDNASGRDGGDHLNMGYNALRTSEIRCVQYLRDGGCTHAVRAVAKK